MRAPTIAEAIDEYLHVIVRTRPWTRKSEEVALSGFADWLGGQATLTSVSPALASRYVQEAKLTPDRAETVLDAVNRLLSWVQQTDFGCV
jgi:hypothetical protein